MSEYVEPGELQQERERSAAPTAIDVRRPADYVASHLPGARNISAEETPSHLAEIPRDRPIVVY
jgi:rhodanese-related sulfurtransferase